MAKDTRTAAKASGGFTAEEREALQERARELKSAARGERARAVGLADLLAKIAEMPEPDRSLAERVHELVTANAPEFLPKTWYGMPAYALDGKVICFFQAASKFNVRYATFGFQPDAQIDDGTMWPTSFALTELSPAHEAVIAELVKRSVG